EQYVRALRVQRRDRGQQEQYEAGGDVSGLHSKILTCECAVAEPEIRPPAVVTDHAERKCDAIVDERSEAAILEHANFEREIIALQHWPAIAHDDLDQLASVDVASGVCRELLERRGVRGR